MQHEPAFPFGVDLGVAYAAKGKKVARVIIPPSAATLDVMGGACWTPATSFANQMFIGVLLGMFVHYSNILIIALCVYKNARAQQREFVRQRANP